VTKQMWNSSSFYDPHDFSLLGQIMPPIGSHAFPVMAASAWVWNILPESVIILSSIAAFQQVLKMDLHRRTSYEPGELQPP